MSAARELFRNSLFSMKIWIGKRGSGCFNSHHKKMADIARPMMSMMLAYDPSVILLIPMSTSAAAMM